MPVSKYTKYFTPLPLDHGGGGEAVGRFVGAKHFEGAPFYFVWHPIPTLKEPYVMIKDPHNHDFDQYLGFFGSDPMDIENLGKDVEIELHLGACRTCLNSSRNSLRKLRSSDLTIL
jgi:hypothetical protein